MLISKNECSVHILRGPCTNIQNAKGKSWRNLGNEERQNTFEKVWQFMSSLNCVVLDSIYQKIDPLMIISNYRTKISSSRSCQWFWKVNSVQEACDKCFAVYILRFEILQITWKNETKNIRLLVFSFSPIDLSFFIFFVRFFHVVSKISNFDMWTEKHLAQDSCAEFTLLIGKTSCRWNSFEVNHIE